MQKSSTLRNILQSRFLLLLMACLSFCIAFFISGKKTGDFSSAAGRFEKNLHANEAHAKEQLTALSEKTKTRTYKEIFSEKPSYYENLFQREGLVFLIFENDTLRFWTDNTVAIENNLSQNNFANKVVKLPNGWFEVMSLSEDKKNLFALILIKREYPYDNKYLKDAFQSEYNLSGKVQINIDTTKRTEKHKSNEDLSRGDVHSSDGEYLFTLGFTAATSENPFDFFIAVILNILGFVLFVWFWEAECEFLSDKIGKRWKIVLFTLIIIALRYFTVQIGFPKIFYETKLFNPNLFGDASFVWLNSLGDLLINAILLFYLVFYCHKNISIEKNKNKLQIVFLFVLLLVLFFCSRIINYLFSGIISNSDIPFTLNDIFSQNIYTYISLTIIGLFFISYFLLIDKIASLAYLEKEKLRQNIVIILSSIAVFIFISYLLGTVDFILILWPALLFLIVLWIKYKQNAYPFSIVVVLLFIISFFSAHVVLRFVESKEHDSRKVFAQKLSAEQDPLAEHLFAEIEKSISTDTSLVNLLEHPHKNRFTSPKISKTTLFTKALLDKYFSGYWEKYDIRVSVFDTVCFPIIQYSSPQRDNLSYFEDIISTQAVPTESKNFFYLTKSTGKISYLARIPLIQKKKSLVKIADLYIEFDSRVISDEIGFPELLLSDKTDAAQSLLDYSYAKYKNGKLVTYHGKFPYGLTSETFLPDSINQNNYPFSTFKSADNYEHLLYMPDADTLVVISKKSEGNIKAVTTFSYLFAFFSLLLMFLIFLRILIFERRFRIESFRSRIQYVLVGIVLVSLLCFGLGTIYYIIQQYQTKNLETIREKTHSALIEMEGKLSSNEALLPSQKDYANLLLKKFSAAFFTDINLYSKDGDLLASSVSKIFDEGILSRKMCPEAFYEMAVNQKLEFINKEQIGNLNYLSAYLPFKNDRGEVVAFLNLPYFARQSELQKEISAILAAIINIYVLLFIISVIVAILISEYVTKPLKLIQEKLGKIKLGKANEPIEWKAEDEIGSLVNEYNRMIEELQKSAELLAKSERETAWREMAKQVAHEIKNPLTPMKLSIQHLQRTWKNKDDDMDKKIERITQTLIEQIETLSTIASEFSNFAQMPTSVSEKINLKNILENSISLFKDSTDTEFIFDSSVEDAFVFADKEQMLRVCNNLLKNALQAIPENQQGNIEVTLSQKENSFLIKIKDNGTGIPIDKMNKIFNPDFTTKTGGMGLGLAMAKSIVETFGGKIWFETTTGKGTTFFVSIPEYKE